MVMGILAVVLGGGLGMFAALDFGKRQAGGLIKSVVRNAQNTAIARQIPTRVRIDKKKNTIRVEALQVIGTWHFENKRIEGFGVEGSAPHELFHEDGFIGDAISFGRSYGEKALIPVHLDPAFDFTEGFAIDLALRWEDTGGGRILKLGNVLLLELGRGGALRGRFSAAVQKDGELSRGAPVVVQSENGAVSPEGWTRVRLQYDRQELVLLVDGVPVAVQKEEAPVWEIDEPIELSDGTRPFPGSLDALVCSAVVTDQEIELPESVSFAEETPDWIGFAAGGGLDRRRHPEPQVVTLTHVDGSQEKIAIGIYGTVE